MTVGELIELLQRSDLDAEIRIECDNWGSSIDIKRVEIDHDVKVTKIIGDMYGI